MDDQREAGADLDYLVSRMRLSEDEVEESSTLPPEAGFDPRAARNLLQKAFSTKKNANKLLRHGGLPFVCLQAIKQK
ncbi:hypothetical protein N0V83_005190 [Neocucurbitaria cava]|uniref:Uncharacterized protein n=1 Tax=Neocucurbitaria cava TaxID=798079 RepID=A0A9W8YA81_9PLEO|nr:hypothetical protein N0V83_005190 [Neocucurbitaria cava]